MTPTGPLRLVTIPPSHFSEKARWALDRGRIRFREERHVPALHVAHVRRAGGHRSVPTLVTPQGTLGDSTDILRWVDEHAAQRGFLYGDEPVLSRDIAALEDRFDTRVGPHVIRTAYSALLPDRKLTLDTLCHGVPFIERLLLTASFAAFRRMIDRGFDLSPAAVARSHARLQAEFDAVAERLADGRPYLAGPVFSAADLTWGALTGPIVMPPAYGSYLPPEHHLPDAWRTMRDRYRATPGGKFALRLYEHERNV